jgi:hypothetical protein
MESADNMNGIGEFDYHAYDLLELEPESYLSTRIYNYEIGWLLWNRCEIRNLSALFLNAVINTRGFTSMMKNHLSWAGVLSAERKWRSAYRQMDLPLSFFVPINFVCFF